MCNVYNYQYKNDNDFNEYNEQRLNYKQNALEGYLYTYIYLQNTFHTRTSCYSSYKRIMNNANHIERSVLHKNEIYNK